MAFVKKSPHSLKEKSVFKTSVIPIKGNKILGMENKMGLFLTKSLQKLFDIDLIGLAFCLQTSDFKNVNLE